MTLLDQPAAAVIPSSVQTLLIVVISLLSLLIVMTAVLIAKVGQAGEAAEELITQMKRTNDDYLDEGGRR